MKGNLALKPLLLLCVVLFLNGALACGLGTPAPTEPPAPAAPTDTPVPPPTDTPTPVPTGVTVQEATFTLGVDEDGQPLDSVSDFAPDAKVYLVLTLKGRPEGTITGHFYRGDESLGEADLDLSDLNSGVIFSIGENTFVNFWMAADADNPSRISDAYRIDVSYADQVVGSYPFQVVPPLDAVPSQIKEVTLARGVDSDYNPTEPTTTFAPDEEVYLVARGDIGLYAFLQADWYVDGELDEAGTRSFTAQENASDVGLYFSFVPDNGWPVGQHEVVLTMNDGEVGRYDFTIEEAPTASEVSTPATDLVPFEDPAGVFSLSYPADFDQVEEDRTQGYSYTFSPSDRAAAINVYFASLDRPFSDDEWRSFAESYTAAGSSAFAEDAVELDRQMGSPGVHAIYLELESKESGLHGLMWIEEAEGIMAVALLVTPIDQWTERQEAISASLDSFTWSPEAASAVIPEPTPEVETPTSVPPTPTSPPPPTATLAPPPSSEWWPGQPEVPPGKACFLVVSSVGGEITFNLGPQTQKIPPNGHIWFVIDPGHTTWTADMPDGRRGGGELDIQPGCEPFVNALSLSG